MKITIIGPGAMGTLLATKLCTGGAQVTLVTKKKHKSLYRNGNIKIINEKKTRKFKVRISYNIEQADYIILAVKSYNIAELINSLRNIETPIIACQNGLQTMHILKKEFKGKKISYLVTGHGVTSIEPGEVRHKGKGFTFLGNIYNEQKTKIKEVVKCLNDGGMDTTYVDNIQDYVWLKTIINSAINPLAASKNIRNGGLKKKNLQLIMHQICNESTNIAKHRKVKLPLDPWKEINNIIDKTSDNKCSMLQDLNNNRKTEIEAINGEIIRIGKKENLDILLNLKYYNKIKLLSN